jgi:hypothetical protein
MRNVLFQELNAFKDHSQLLVIVFARVFNLDPCQFVVLQISSLQRRQSVPEHLQLFFRLCYLIIGSHRFGVWRFNGFQPHSITSCTESLLAAVIAQSHDRFALAFFKLAICRDGYVDVFKIPYDSSIASTVISIPQYLQGEAICLFLEIFAGWTAILKLNAYFVTGNEERNSGSIDCLNLLLDRQIPKLGQGHTLLNALPIYRFRQAHKESGN